MSSQLWFYKGPGRFFDWLIRKYTGSIYSHVAIVTGSTVFSADAWQGKVVMDDISNYNVANWDIAGVVAVKDPQWLLEQVGKSYDWQGIFGFFAGKSENPNKWYCSELAAAYIGATPRPISPQMLYDMVR